jgi:hypothetical protein
MICTASRTSIPTARAVARWRDHDISKGAIEDGYPSTTTNAPGWDADGLPDDETVIAAYALGARIDGSPG